MKYGKTPQTITLQLSAAPLEITPRVYLRSRKQHQPSRASHRVQWAERWPPGTKTAPRHSDLGMEPYLEEGSLKM